MKNVPQIHHWRSIRLDGYDYTQLGAYFITICTFQRAEIFGKIADEETILNQFGKIVRDEWFKTADIRQNVELFADEFVVMPNHVHGILWIVEPEIESGTGLVRATQRNIDFDRATRRENGFVQATRRIAPTGSLGAFLGQFKSITAKRFNVLRGVHGLPIWQRNYYEHIIRNENDLGKIRDYIQTNPQRWQEDQLHPSAPSNPFKQDRT